MRVGPRGHERPVLALDDNHYDLTTLTPDIDGDFLASDGPERARRAAEAGDLEPVDVTGLRVGAPIARPGAGPPAAPVISFKHPNAEQVVAAVAQAARGLDGLDGLDGVVATAGTGAVGSIDQEPVVVTTGSVAADVGLPG